MPAVAQLHVSPDLRLGPYLGVGGQLGVTDIAGFEAVYASVGTYGWHFLTDKERIQRYRLGIQYQPEEQSSYALQFEAGIAKYHGERRYFSRTEQLDATGPSLAGAIVIDSGLPVLFRAGIEINYFRHRDTFIPGGVSPNVTAGIIIPFN